MTKYITIKVFDEAITELKECPEFTGCVFETANIIEAKTQDTLYNRILSKGLIEGWIEETA